LYVEDEPGILAMFAQMVRPRHDVILAKNGTEALEHLLSDEEIDVTILDLMLGVGPSGLEVLDRIAEFAPARLERLIVISGAMWVPGIDKAVAAYRVPTTGRPVPVIEKPFRVETLERDVLAQYGVSTAPRGPRFGSKGRPALQRPEHHPHPRPRHVSEPKLPDYGEDEVSKVTQLAEQHEPIAMAVRDNRRDVADLSARMGKVEAHFVDDGEGKKGLVRQIDANVAAIRSNFGLIRNLLILSPIVFGGLFWLIHTVTQPPPPERIDYDRIVREVSAKATAPK